ncbi:C-C chemokine receptor type 7-like protein [Labeo rohita]|uniref:C-C chemokine receptor type 7-like protein n=1 Tax=Labeo rohita TaxID=84645 RepID=A0A498L9R5_LABRO|nr:C-C chemokine receptor type 7-like protein [Labeo rohita]RXN24650.1 C-C chemokine receptor type 7-like protein [Labeo rohita]
MFRYRRFTEKKTEVEIEYEANTLHSMESFDSTTLFGFTNDYDLNYTDIDFVTDPNVTEVAELCVASKEQERTITAVQTMVFLITFLLGVTGNGLVIATFIRWERRLLAVGYSERRFLV